VFSETGWLLQGVQAGINHVGRLQGGTATHRALNYAARHSFTAAAGA